MVKGKLRYPYIEFSKNIIEKCPLAIDIEASLGEVGGFGKVFFQLKTILLAWLRKERLYEQTESGVTYFIEFLLQNKQQ